MILVATRPPGDSSSTALLARRSRGGTSSDIHDKPISGGRADPARTRTEEAHTPCHFGKSQVISRVREHPGPNPGPLRSAVEGSSRKDKQLGLERTSRAVKCRTHRRRVASPEKRPSVLVFVSGPSRRGVRSRRFRPALSLQISSLARRRTAR